MLFDQIYLYDKDRAFNDIIKFYNNNWYCIINFLYFWNVIWQKILKKNKSYIQKKYLEALKHSDFLLPDWIAVKLFMQKQFCSVVHNLNWTDFIPYFFQNLNDLDADVFLYWADKDVIPKAKNFLKETFWINVLHFQDWYSQMNLSNFSQNKGKMKVLLVGRGTPLQEIWIYENLDFFKKNWFVVFGVGGLFDFWWWKEKRSPLFFRKLKIEWLYRLFTNPKKNWKKVYNSLFLIKYLVKSLDDKTLEQLK